MGGFGGRGGGDLAPGTYAWRPGTRSRASQRRGGRAGPRAPTRAGPGAPTNAGPGTGGRAGPGGGHRPPSFDANEAEYDPFLKRQAGRLEARMADTEGRVGRELDLATGRRRAQTGAQMQSGRLDLARRGMLDTSSGEETMTTDLMGAESADLADIQAGISYDREAANDRFMLGATAGLAMPGDAARGDRAVNRRAYADQLAQWEADQSYELQRKAQGLNSFLAQLNFLSGPGGIGHVATGKL